MPARARPASTLSAMTPKTTNDSGSRNSSFSKEKTRDKIRAAKATKSCCQCAQFGHWVSDHAPNGFVAPSVLSSGTPLGPVRTKLSERRPAPVANQTQFPVVFGAVQTNMASTSGVSISSTALDDSDVALGPLSNKRSSIIWHFRSRVVRSISSDAFEMSGRAWSST